MKTLKEIQIYNREKLGNSLDLENILKVLSATITTRKWTRFGWDSSKDLEGQPEGIQRQIFELLGGKDA